jgi:hypothetical protein
LISFSVCLAAVVDTRNVGVLEVCPGVNGCPLEIVEREREHPTPHKNHHPPVQAIYQVRHEPVRFPLYGGNNSLTFLVVKGRHAETGAHADFPTGRTKREKPLWCSCITLHGVGPVSACLSGKVALRFLAGARWLVFFCFSEQNNTCFETLCFHGCLVRVWIRVFHKTEIDFIVSRFPPPKVTCLTYISHCHGSRV